MADTTQKAVIAEDQDVAPRVYDRRALTYSDTFDSPVKRALSARSSC